MSKFSWSDNNILLLLEAANTFKSIWEYKSVRRESKSDKINKTVDENHLKTDENDLKI